MEMKKERSWRRENAAAAASGPGGRGELPKAGACFAES